MSDSSDSVSSPGRPHSARDRPIQPAFWEEMICPFVSATSSVSSAAEETLFRMSRTKDSFTSIMIYPRASSKETFSG